LYSATYAAIAMTRRALQLQEVSVDWQERAVLQRTLRPSNCICPHTIGPVACSQQAHHCSDQPHQAFTP